MTNQEYQELYDKIVEVKNKYVDHILEIDGVHGVGVDVFGQAIVVSVDRLTMEGLLQIPTELDGYPVECKGDNPPTPYPPPGPSEADPMADPAPFDNLPQQVVYPKAYKWFDENYIRPLTSGNSIGKMYWAGSGTLSAIFWSNRLQKHVAHTCRHVLGGRGETFYRQDTNNSLDFNILPGGTPYTGPDFSDFETLVWRRRPNAYLSMYKSYYPDTPPEYQLDYGNPNGTSHINSIAPASGMAGAVITINTIGCGNRRGHSQVLFNGVPAKLKSWVSTYDYLTFSDWLTTIEAYVPDIPYGSIQVKLNVEGETVLGPSMNDGSDIIRDAIGQVEAIIPWQTDMQSDSTLINLDEGLTLKSEIPMKPAPDKFTSGKMSVNALTALGGVFPGRQYRMQGIYRGPYYEGMCVMKTGRTTGTTFGIVRMPSYDWQVSYSDVGWRALPNAVVRDTIECYAPRFINNEQPSDPEIEDSHPNWSADQITVPGYGNFNLITEFSAAGDSGSGVYTADYADYVAYCEQYGLYIEPRRPDLLPDPPAGLLMATLTFGNSWTGNGGGDKAYKYVDYHDLDINRLPMEIAGEKAMSTSSQVTAIIEVEWSASPHLKSVSTIEVTTLLGTIINLVPIGLVSSTALIDHDSINFTARWYLREIGTNAPLNLGASPGLSVGLVPAVPVGLGAYGPTHPIPVLVGMMVVLVPVIQLGSIAGPINVSADVTLTVDAYVDLTADIKSTSSGALGMQAWGVTDVLPTELVSHIEPFDNLSIDFTLMGYSRTLNVNAPIDTPVGLGMSVQVVELVQLGAAIPLNILPSSIGAQLIPSAVSLTALSTHATVTPAVRVNIELVVKLLPLFLSRPSRELEVQAVINNTTYDKTEVISFDIEDSLIPSEEFVLGSVISSKLTISLRTGDTIPSNATVSPYVRLKGPEGVTEWVALGKYYIDTRGNQNNVWTFTCFDKIILSQQTFVSSLT